MLRCLGFGFLFCALLACDKPATLPSFGAVPAFLLHDQRGHDVSLATFAGKIWIADFIFTSCPDVCPMLTEEMAGLRKRVPAQEALAFVSFSVDPEHDTPDKLARFADQHHGNQPNWYFLTGGTEDLKRVVVSGFKQAMQEVAAEPNKPRNILHGTHFVLVDGQGAIRGFYRSDPEGQDQLEAAVKNLLGSVKSP